MSKKGGVMIKRIGALALSLIITSSQFAARSDCFRPYQAEISNKSGGLAIVQKTHGIAGISRKVELENNSTIRVMIKRLGAELEVLAGLEDAKSLRHVKFFCKEPNTPTAQVILNPKGIATSNFYTENKPYDVKIINESGGNLMVVETVAAGSMKQTTLVDGKTATLTVRPGAYIVVKAGPENKKVSYRIDFAEQTGVNPTVLFTNRSFTSRGITHKDVEVKAYREFHGIGIRKPIRRAATESVLMQRTPRNSQYRNGQYPEMTTMKKVKRSRRDRMNQITPA